MAIRKTALLIAMSCLVWGGVGVPSLPSHAEAAVEISSNVNSAWPGRLGRYVFEVSRDGTPIGTQSIEVSRQGDTVTAVTESQVAVKMLGVTVYRMHQVITETYHGRRLQTMRAQTKDGSGTRVAELTRDGDHWTGRSGKTASAFDCDCQTSAMWHVSSIGKNQIIEASKARLRQVTVTDRGSENLNLPEGRTAARHFTVKGDIKRDVWYDSAGNLVAAGQVGSDGSLIRQKLIADPGMPDAAENDAGAAPASRVVR
jgi:hypothetical protein